MTIRRRRASGGAAHRLVAVRDEPRAARTGRCRAQIAVVPGPASRRPDLRCRGAGAPPTAARHSLGWSPPGRYLVVQGNGSMVNEADRISMAIDAVVAERPDLGVADLDREGHGDASSHRHSSPGTLTRVASRCPAAADRHRRDPRRCAETFVGILLHGAVTTIATGPAAVVFNGAGQSKLRVGRPPRRPARLRRNRRSTPRRDQVGAHDTGPGWRAAADQAAHRHPLRRACQDDRGSARGGTRRGPTAGGRARPGRRRAGGTADCARGTRQAADRGARRAGDAARRA